MIAQSGDPKRRVVILSDISNEPDDQMSLVRFLAYANEFDVEGLIATTSCWRKNNPDVETIHRVIDAYGEARKNLVRHAEGYPTVEQLRRVTFSGVDGYGMEAAAQQLDNAAVRHIISLLRENDPRPVWFCAWGGGNTLGAAVMTLQRDHPNEVASLVSKIRGYEIALQDDGWAYIAHHFPETHLISARLLWKGISRTTPTFNAWSESWGGNNAVFSADWIARNIQNDHGPLGKMYPSAIYLWEGDTPSFLYLVPNGLNDPGHVNFGGWGGRFDPERKTNVRSGTGNDTVDGLLDRHRDYALFSDAQDRWSYDGRDYHNEHATIFRWREDFQNDFAARMDWCVAETLEAANHNPVAVLNGNRTRGIVQVTAKPGSTVKLSARGSSDPDGDRLSFTWFVYREPSTLIGDYMLSQTSEESTTLTIPKPIDNSTSNPTIHVVLTVKDNGTPPLVSYRRAVITVQP